jgi:signal transduction histidine kinase
VAASGSTVTVTAQPNVVGEWDRFRIEQLVTNLLSNAIKFGLGNPIELTASCIDGRARVVVRDHGIGIDPCARERIFLPFERAVSVRHYGGLGLGLHIVSTTVRAMGGSVAVESAPGAGATFVLELPLRTSEAGDADPRR